MQIRCRVELRLRAAAVTHPNALAEHFVDPQREPNAYCVSDSDGNCNQIRKLYVVRYGDKNGDSESVSIRQQRRVPTFIANERCELNDSSECESIPADAVSHIFCERIIGRVSDNGRRWLALQLG